MMMRIGRVACAGALLGVLAWGTACNTFKGLGTDIKTGAEKTEEAITGGSSETSEQQK